ncbi:MAG TPA: hypothetical protein VF638_14780 [Sphingomonas sp.]
MTLRLVTMVQPSFADQIDEYMWANRFRNRSDAVRALIEVGLSGGAAADRPALGLVVQDNEPEPAPIGPLPVIRLPDAQMVGVVPAVVQWLNAAIQREQRAKFTEDEIYRGCWRKPDGYELLTSDRNVVRRSMGEIGWIKRVDRRGRSRGDHVTTWEAPEASSL